MEERRERDESDDRPELVGAGDFLSAWVRVALNSFGGPAGQIAVMHRILVEERRWVSERRFLHALNYCMLLPGPEAQQLATYTGWLLRGWRGGLVAGGLFILPGFLSIMLLSFVYVLYGQSAAVAGLFFGLTAAVLAVVVEATIRIGRRALRNGAMVGVAVAAFVAIFFFEVPFPLIVAGSALVGVVLSRVAPRLVVPATRRDEGASRRYLVADDARAAGRPPVLRSILTAALWSGLWWAPMVVLAALGWGATTFTSLGVFFSTAAVVTFGGAYAVLAYIAQQAVEVHGWLAPGEMLTGLGMAETTPGPLIQVVQFVGFMAAYRVPEGLEPLLAGVLGAVVTTWVTFAPCFLWIFVGAPYIEYLRGRASLDAALSAITAAVVGVILNLAVWFSVHVLFSEVHEARLGVLRVLIPDLATLNAPALAIAAAASVALFRFHAGMIPVLLGAAAVGLGYGLVVGTPAQLP